MCCRIIGLFQQGDSGAPRLWQGPCISRGLGSRTQGYSWQKAAGPLGKISSSSNSLLEQKLSRLFTSLLFSLLLHSLLFTSFFTFSSGLYFVPFAKLPSSLLPFLFWWLCSFHLSYFHLFLTFSSWTFLIRSSVFYPVFFFTPIHLFSLVLFLSSFFSLSVFFSSISFSPSYVCLISTLAFLILVL